MPAPEKPDPDKATNMTVAAVPSAMQRKQPLIVFDWDDTLLPLTWIEQNRLRQKQLPKGGDLWDQLAKHARAVVQLLQVAQSLGAVAVVTLAQRPWVSESTR